VKFPGVEPAVSDELAAQAVPLPQARGSPKRGFPVEGGEKKEFEYFV